MKSQLSQFFGTGNEFKNCAEIFKKIDQISKIKNLFKEDTSQLKSEYRDQILKKSGTIINKLNAEQYWNLNEEIEFIRKCEDQLFEINGLYNGVSEKYKIIRHFKAYLQNLICKINYYSNNAQQICEQLIIIRKVHTKVKEFKEETNEAIDEVLNKCKEKNGSVFLLQMGNILEASIDSEGQEIIDYFKQFQQAKICQFNRKTNSHSLEYIIENFQVSKNWSNKAKLDKKTMIKYYKCYEQEYKKIVQYLQNIKQEEQLRQKALTGINQELNNNKNQSISLEQLSEDEKMRLIRALANIGAYYTLHDQQGKIMLEENGIPTYKQLHSVQVISIMLMLGILEKWQNQLIEILTGEGKSIALGVCSIIFALLGYTVDVVCYNEYLSKRDYKSFQKIFQNLHVSQKITYGTFINLAEKYIDKNGDIRQLVLDSFIGKYRQIECQNKKRKSILFIDEVDVFFKPDFYGSTRNPLAFFRGEDIKKLIEKVWELNKNEKNSEEIVNLIKQDTVYQSIENKFPGLKQYLENQLKKMACDVKKIIEHKQKTQYQIIEKKWIGYKSFESITTSTYYGYMTMFSYIFESENGQIPKANLPYELSLQIDCGNISYALIPAQYDRVLGVSGTLGQLSNQIKQAMKEYKINLTYYAPSMFSQSKRKFNRKYQEDVFIEANEEEQFIKITEIAQEKINNNQAVIIFLKNQQQIEAYKSFSDVQNKFQVQVLAESSNQDDIEFKVMQSTKNKYLTLCVRDFGRGTDFICRDKVVQENGGVVVILAFLCQDNIEETQVMGRTARQDQKGEFYIVLDKEKLIKKLKIENQQSMPTQFNELQRLRDQKAQQKLEKKQQSVANSMLLHNKTMEFYKALWNANKDEILNFINAQ